MPAKRELTMRQLRYMLRLHHDGVSAREIGRTLGVARSTIQDNLRRAQASGIAWPVPAELTDDILEQRLFARAGSKAGLSPTQRAGLGNAGARTQAPWREPDGAVGGISAEPAGRLRLQPVLRSVPRIRAAAFAGDAPASCCRRQGVRRLFGQADCNRRSRHGRFA